MDLLKRKGVVVLEKEQIKKILENHIDTLSKISSNETALIDNPLLMYLLTESIKTTSLTLLFLNKL